VRSLSRDATRHLSARGIANIIGQEKTIKRLSRGKEILMRRKHRQFTPLLLCFFFATAVAPLRAQQAQSCGQEQEKPSKKKQEKPNKSAKEEKAAEYSNWPAVLWHDPSEIAALDVVGGPGGRDKAPRADDQFTFVEEDLNGTSTKFYVKDSSGVPWLVKVGDEAKPETAAARFVWAMGYFADQDYYVEFLHVANMQKLTHGHGHNKITSDIHGARLKRADVSGKKIANWSWFNNPFIGTREFNRLRALMAVINNWDLTTENNKIYPVNAEREYVVSDLGASFGKTGSPAVHLPLPHATKGVLKDYANARLIRQTAADSVTFEMRTKGPFFERPFKRDYFRMYTCAEQVAANIPIADARWLGQQLSRLTPQQIRDIFRASGYSPEEVEGYAKAVEARIAQLRAL